ncbi:MAG: ABC transporter ATP-binding protein/permease [Deltaproteobacteria bacterium]|nr:ABC transporter ATP-binding protein/permease [Deltaproteobacteria bacterium]
MLKLLKKYIDSLDPRKGESGEEFIRLTRYFRPYMPQVLLALACALMVSGTSAATAYLLQPVMDRIFDQKDWTFLKLLPWIVIILFGAKGIFRFLQNYVLRAAGEKVIRHIRGELYRHYQYLDVAYFTNTNVGVMMSRITNDVNVMQRAVPTLVSLFREPVTMIGLACVAFYQFWQMALIILVLFPLTAVPLAQLGRRVRKWVRRGQERMGELNSILKETFSGERVIKVFGMEEYEIGRFEKENNNLFRANVKTLVYEELSSPVIEALGALGAAVAIVYGGSMVLRGSITTGEFFSFVGALGLMYEPLKKVNKMYQAFQAAIGAAGRVFEVLNTKPEITDRPDAVDLDGVRGEVRFDNVRFRYFDGGPHVLDGLDFKVNVGQLIAFVGSSGAGKTTVANLIPRFWDVTEGAIRIDGRDIRDFTLTSLRRHIGMVTQDTFLFNDTVLANIAYGDGDADKNRAMRAAKDANAHQFIERLPSGYETTIGELGVKLSGGQRQRLAIARAIYKNAPILVLDEATSALDAESEREVQLALERLLVGRTSFVIAHRLSTIQRADRILVLRDGRVVEDGRHDELIVHDGEYARLYRIQFDDGREG